MNRACVGTVVRLIALLAGACAAWMARADTDEAWLRRAPLAPGVRPLLAIVLDRSAATSRTLAAREAYDPERDYGAALPASSACDRSRVYFRRGPGPAPDCQRQAGIDLVGRRPESGLQCNAASAALASAGFYIASRAAQWHAEPDAGYWGSLRESSTDAVECRADRGRHGATAGNWFASDGTGAPWTNVETREIDWDRPPFADAYAFYAGNYLNYLQAVLPVTQRSVAELGASLLAQSLAATDELDVALIRLDDDGGDGGYVARAPASSQVVAADLRALASTSTAGNAQLSETLAEAALWLQGGPRRFGVDARMDPGAMDTSGTYHSPFEHACRPVSLALLSTGIASEDDNVALAAESLTHFNEETGGCGVDCLATLGRWVGSTDLRDDLPGRQASPTSWIVPPTSPFAASSDAASPADPLGYVNVIARVFQRDAAVPAGPQLSSAALTPIHGSADDAGVILGLTAPHDRARWPGNLFRYRLRSPATPLEPPLVVDRDGEPAIDAASGLPMPGSQNLWSDAPDANLLAGGANGRLPPSEERRIHTNIASARILDPANRLAPGNARIDRAAVGLGTTDPELLDDVLAWPAAQRTLGDVGFDAPLMVEYPDSNRTIAYAATQDGVLHAFDADSGVELWGWMPKELLPRIPDLMRDAETTVRVHGIDGQLVVHRYDPDGDGRIASTWGEHQWLMFGLGRGGGRYYALDIASPLDPRLAWSFPLPDAEVEARAEPVVTRLVITGSGQSAGNWVVLVAGGYDPRFDARGATGIGRGAVLRVLDALTGRELWSMGGEGATYPLAGLASLASAPRALDLDGDGFLDRAYLLDVTGSLWRFDFANGRPPDGIAAARRLARLGTDVHRFFATPDAALVRIGNEPRLALSMGSGWLTRPRDESIEDRAYVIFDRTDGSTIAEVSETDLYDATDDPGTVPLNAAGWFVRLDAHGAGEKVIGSTATFDHVLRFQTYQPGAADPSAPCGPPPAIVRRYAFDVRNALPREFAVESEEDDADSEDVTGLPADIRFGFPGLWSDLCEGCRPRPFGLVGGDTFDPGYAGDPVRTSWRKLAPPPASP